LPAANLLPQIEASLKDQLVYNKIVSRSAIQTMPIIARADTLDACIAAAAVNQAELVFRASLLACCLTKALWASLYNPLGQLFEGRLASALAV
jgi:hypothetical protein